MKLTAVAWMEGGTRVHKFTQAGRRPWSLTRHCVISGYCTVMRIGQCIASITAVPASLYFEVPMIAPTFVAQSTFEAGRSGLLGHAHWGMFRLMDVSSRSHHQLDPFLGSISMHLGVPE